MRSGRIGGTLVIGGWLVFIIAGVFLAGGSSVGIGNGEIGSLALALGVALVGSGAAVVSVGGPRPLDGVVIRAGLAILGLGLLTYLASSVVAGLSPYDPLESWPFVILFLGGGFATFIGATVTVISLPLKPGRTRSIGWLFLVGLGLVIVAGILASSFPTAVPFDLLAGGLAIIGGCAIVGAGAAIGYLAIDGDRSAKQTVA